MAVWAREKRHSTPLKRTDSGTAEVRGRKYTAGQMRARAEVLVQVAHYLRNQIADLNEDQAAAAELLASDLLTEVPKWRNWAMRCTDPLGPELRRTYQFLVDHVAELGAWPCIEAFAAVEGVNRSTIQVRLRKLHDKGFLRKAPRAQGGWTLVGEPTTSQGPRGHA